MTLYDLADSNLSLPAQLIADSSLLLALRPEDDNPNSQAAYRFIESVGREADRFNTVLWLPTPVIQECYHIILSRSLRRVCAHLPLESRPPNWLAAYKQQPHLLAEGFADLEAFDEILASIPVTPIDPILGGGERGAYSVVERMRYFIQTYYLFPQDALILAEAERIGVKAVATLDKDWRRVAEFDIYTTPL